MSQLVENLFESTRLSGDSLTKSAGRPYTVNSTETRVKINLSDDPTESISGSVSSLQTVKVFLRLKPRTPKSKRTKRAQDESYSVVNSEILSTKIPAEMISTSSTRKCKSNEAACKKFFFTKIFDHSSTQSEVFENCATESISDFIAGKNSTIISYGTKNSGKTFTFFGTPSSMGIIPRTFKLIFSNVTCTLSPWYKPSHKYEIINLDGIQKIKESEVREKLLSTLIDKQTIIDSWRSLENTSKPQCETRKSEIFHSIWISFAEIFNENIYDLLGDVDEDKTSPLKLITDKQGRAFVPGLTMICATTGLEAYQIMLSGQSRLSSLSHSILTIIFLKYFKKNSTDEVDVSTLTFCDLAGSGKTQNPQIVGDSVKEMRNIKTGLLALGRCLKSVHDCQSAKTNAEILGPFRESKLTRLFQRPLSGKESLTIIANINPAPDLYVENQSVLNLCSIAKKIFITPTRELKRTFTSEQTISIPEISAELENEQQLGEDKDQDHDKLREDNKAFKKEIEKLRSSSLKRELEIREEMANLYLGMMEDVDCNWRKRTEEVEKDQENILKWSVEQVESFYKERIDSIKNRKRRRTDCGDYEDECLTPLQELELENNMITSKLVSMKETLKNIKAERDIVRQEKNTHAFELGLANEVLREIRGILGVEGDFDPKQNKNLINRLNAMIAEKNSKIESLESHLDKVEQSLSALQIETENSLSTGKNGESIVQSSLDTSEQFRRNDSGIESCRMSSSTRNSLNTSTDNKSIQVSDSSNPDDRRIAIQDRLEELKLDYQKLKLDHLHESIRVCELSDELGKLRNVMQDLKETTLQNEKKMLNYQQRVACHEEDLGTLEESKIELESKLASVCIDLERASLKCITEHVPKIEKVETDLQQKTERVIELDEKVLQSSRDLVTLSKLNNRVSDFEDILEKCRCEREDLRRQLQERTLSQSSLECRLKLLSSRVQDKENEIKSLRTDLADIFRVNGVNSECAYELSRNIGDAVARLTTVENETRRSEVEKRKLERASSHEISNLAAKCETFKKLGMIRGADDGMKEELRELKLKLLTKERELSLFKKNRDCTLRRYESLIRKLQRDVDRNSRESLRMKKLFPTQSFSKESLKSGERRSLKTPEVRPGFSVKTKSFPVRKKRSCHHCRLTNSSKRSSLQIMASLTSLNDSRSSESRTLNSGQKSTSSNTSPSVLEMIKVEGEEGEEEESIIAPRVYLTSIPSTSDESASDYKEIPTWTKIMRSNGRTQFVIHQAEITVENASPRNLQLDGKTFKEKS